jgi:hypothetical protein
MYVLEDKANGQWCGYANERAFESKVNSLSSMHVATVDYEDDHVLTLKITEEDETGDWSVHDEYSVDSGEIRQLKRTINVIPGNRSLEEVFHIRNGRAKKDRTVSRELGTNKLAPSSNIWLPNLPVITTLHAFPFVRLLENKSDEVWSKGSSCDKTGGDN